jgi:hypothetical protein
MTEKSGEEIAEETGYYEDRDETGREERAEAEPWTVSRLGMPETVLPLKHKDQPIGTVAVCWADAGHAAVSTGDGYNLGGDVTFKGRRWQVFVSLYAASGGWTEIDPAHPESRFHLPEFQDADVYGKAAAPSYRAAIVAAITEAVTAFVTEHPDVLVAAQRSKLTRDRDAARAEMRRIERELELLDIE